MKKTKSTASSAPAATLSEAQRLAAAILEVLAGLQSPSTAAAALGISLPRYYQLEAQALEGLVAALGPRPRGKQPSLEKRVEQLEKELEAARRECARQEALVRVTQRSLGLAAAVKTKVVAPPVPGRKSRKPRQPLVRALRAAQSLREQAETAGSMPIAAVQPTLPIGGGQEAQP